MKKNLLLLSIFVIGFSHLNAQNWCTPNSVWHFNYYSQYIGQGYAELSYAGTVTVNSKICKQLNYFAKYFHPSSVGSATGYIDSVVIAPKYYTYEDNNVVYLYNQNTSNFDTLYNYYAFPGDSWYLPARYAAQSVPTCPKVKVTVLAVGISQVGPLHLKWQKVSLGSSTGSITDTIFQRLGLLNNYFFNFDWCSSKNLHFSEGGALRCFSDNQISTVNRTNQACDFIVSLVGIKENSFNQTLNIYPNPTKDILTIEVNSASFEKPMDITLTDALGRMVKKLSLGANTKIDVSDLENGIYFLQVLENGRVIASEKVVRE